MLKKQELITTWRKWSLGNVTRKASKLFQKTKHLLNGLSEVALPSGKISKELAKEFSDIFISKAKITEPTLLQ